MKTTFKYIVAALAMVAAVASCSRKVDYPVEKFVTLDHYAYSVDETVAEVVIPVHIYNQDSHDVQVAVKFLDNTAVQGTDYEIISPESGLLTFPGGTDSLAIKVAIKPHVGVYTGTKNFGVQVSTSTDGVVHGELCTATVSIKDIDHPLASILGEYTAVGLCKSAGGQAQWKVTLAANDESVSKVNVTNLSWYDETVIGDVSEDLTVITIPYGQMYQASGYATMFCGYAEGGYYTASGNLILTKTENGWAQSADIDTPQRKWGIGCLATQGGTPLGWLDYFYPGIVLVK